MRYVIIIAIVLLGGFLIRWFILSRRVSDGFTFAIYAEEVINIYKTYLEVKNEPGIKELGIEYIKVQYNPEKLKLFLDEMDYIIALTLDCYDKIKDKEMSFQEDDWDYIQELYTSVQDVENKVRYEKWQNGFQVTRLD